ncbi:hypothetical protein [Meleagrid alphaherpesvirus 1]|uniref:LORF3 n=1 Tax=Meleagrid herpesvirus 1 TaxID=37108 RepID=Q9DGS2_MEHV1|nr:protein LORF4 [Meleagrid alphaherpesvirus 1]AKQ48632.1 protein LORF4 [iBAC vector pMeHV1-C7]AKQ48704.1 protein LORF4 [iBAC vector pMeHV1-C9]AKQ48776.1 protein LORF4 [iBAC vector pMeHV1-C10]AKQ48848.1 protein LORF4 [iBAC vector pMeHV1-C17]AKQ48921.1 protein LORF4 [iBAC vector pMeHV1-C18]
MHFPFNKKCRENTQPLWMYPRELPRRGAYGVAARPILITDMGPTINILLVGGWKGRLVTAKSSVQHRAVLWISGGQRENASQYSFNREDANTHGWFLTLGAPWIVGRNILPEDRLLFITNHCSGELQSVFAGMPVALKTVLEHLHLKRESGLQPALLMDPRRFLEMRDPRKIICMCELDIRDSPGAHGILVNCCCGRPGGLQCLTFIRIIETLVNHFLSSTDLTCLNLTCRHSDVPTTVASTLSEDGFEHDFEYSISTISEEAEVY